MVSILSIPVLRLLRSPWCWIPLVAGVALGVAYWPMLRQGYPYTHSIGSNALWAHQFGQQVLAGQLYPRWLETSFASMGSPSFVFYPPLCMWAVVPFAAMGWSVMDQLVGATGLALVLMAVGAFLLARSLFPQCCWLQGICVALAVLSPYFLINIHVRGALGEMWAMVWLVWILWGMQVRLAGDQGWRLLPLSLAILLLALSHLPTLLLFTMFWIPLPLMLLDRRQGILTSLGQILWQLHLPLGLGLGLASFFLVPPLFDQSLINIHFIGIAVPWERLLVDRILQFSFHLTEHDFDRQLLPSLGIIALTGGCAATLGGLSSRLDPWRTSLRVLLWGSLVSLIMVTDLGRGLYAAVGPLERIQFSWRWLAIGSVCWPFLWGMLLASLPAPPQVMARGILGGGALGLTLVLLFWTTGTVWQAAYPWPEKVAQLNQFFGDRPAFPVEVDLTARPYEPVDFGLLRNRLGQPFMTDVSEYTPTWVPGPPHLPAGNYELVEWEAGTGTIADLEWRFGWRRFRVNALWAGQLLLRMYGWPGWQVRVDDRILSGMDHGQDGRLRVPVPAGESWVDVRYVGSAAERWGSWISCVALIGLGLIGRGHRRMSRLLGLQ